MNSKKYVWLMLVHERLTYFPYLYKEIKALDDLLKKMEEKQG